MTQTGRTRGSSGLGVSSVVGYSPLWVLDKAEWEHRIVETREREEVRQETVQSLTAVPERSWPQLAAGSCH